MMMMMLLAERKLKEKGKTIEKMVFESRNLQRAKKCLNTTNDDGCDCVAGGSGDGGSGGGGGLRRRWLYNVKYYNFLGSDDVFDVEA